MPKSFEGNAARKTEMPVRAPRAKRSHGEPRMSAEQLHQLREESSREASEHIGRLINESLSDSERVQTLSAHEKGREALSEDPKLQAERAQNLYYSTFNAASNRGSVNPEMQQDLIGQLRAAKQALEGKQEWLSHGSSKDKKEMQSNWERIKQIEQMLEVASQDPEDALQAYTAEVNAEKMEVRHALMESRLKKVSAKVDGLSQKLTQEYGISPEEMVAGGSPKTLGGKLKMWFRKLSGSQELMEEWRAARAAEDQMIAELSPPPVSRLQDTSGRAKVVRGRKYEETQTDRREGRLAAEDVYGSAHDKTASQLEAEIVGDLEEEEPITLVRNKKPEKSDDVKAKEKTLERLEKLHGDLDEEEPITLVRNRKPEIKEEEPITLVRTKKPAPEAFDDEEEVTQVYKRAKKLPLPPKKVQPTEDRFDLEKSMAPVKVPMPPKEILETGKRQDRRMGSMTIDRAAALVPGADKLWDFVTEKLKENPGVAEEYARLGDWTGTGPERNEATNYVLTIAKYKEAIENNDQERADEMLAHIQKMNKALGISSGNALFQSAFANKRTIDTAKGVKQHMKRSSQKKESWNVKY